MAGNEVHEYVVGLRLMDWSARMDQIEKNRLNAVVRDLNQKGPMNGVEGEYYDAWVDGKLVCSFDTAAEARVAVSRELYRKNHGKYPS